MTFDGDEENGQVTGNTVDMANGCVSVYSSYYGTYTVCNVGQASDVQAAGSIEAVADNGHQCYFQEMWKELSAAGLSLKTTS